MKNKKNVEKIRIKGIFKINIQIVLIIFVLIFIFLAFVFSKKIFAVNDIKNNIQEFIVYRNENPIQLESILNENTKVDCQEELTVDEIDLEYTTVYRNNSNLPSGTIQVLQEGRDGRQNVIAIKKYENGSLISEEIVAENLVKAPVNKIIEVGIGKGKNNYKASIGDVLYVTSNTLAIRVEPDANSEKIATIPEGTEVKIIEIDKDWYYVSVLGQKGYIPVDCVTNMKPNAPIEEIEEDDSQYAKSTLLKNLNFDMKLNVASNLSLSQFKKILGNNQEDINKIFEENAEYFYYAEKQYKINGVFLAAVAIHESGWGKSTISLNKKNLFGYGAYDKNPYEGAYNFSTYSEGIDLLARVFVKYYLNPEGTSIYDGNVASGKFYSGNTLSSVNKRYASDKNWANSVFRWMQYLYNRL